VVVDEFLGRKDALRIIREAMVRKACLPGTAFACGAAFAAPAALLQHKLPPCTSL
jgi:hypothetical protein